MVKSGVKITTQQRQAQQKVSVFSYVPLQPGFKLKFPILTKIKRHLVERPVIKITLIKI